MTDPALHDSQPAISLPAIDALAVNAGKAIIMTPDGEIKDLSIAQAQMYIGKKPVLLCHAPYIKQRLNLKELNAFDVLELYAFVYPAQFCVPTPTGLAKTLGLTPPKNLEDYPITLMEITEALLKDFQNMSFNDKQADPLGIARVMGLQGKGWPWTPYLFAAKGREYNATEPIKSREDLGVWRHMPEWSESEPPPPPSHHGVTKKETLDRLSELVKSHEENLETRLEQQNYAQEIAKIFDPPRDAESPHFVIAEAGTGTGKTLGYLAPASIWAEKNDGSVWVSTYTRNLQRQVAQELDRLCPEKELKQSKVAVRKGRENYLCLLNFEDTVAGAGLTTSIEHAIAAGLMARWAEASNDGDLQGGDFPGWLPGLIGYKHTLGLADRRGECIYSACAHYHRCFGERAIRRARHADIVIANHALVMVQTALSEPGDDLPTRYIFDEAHHLFDAADSAFSGHLTAREGRELRQWIRGAEGGKKTRARGLRRRVEDLITNDPVAQKALNDVYISSGILPAAGWSHRLKDKMPQGPAEEFLMTIYEQVFARAAGRHGPYSLETPTHPLSDNISDLALILKNELQKLKASFTALSKQLAEKRNNEADELDSDTRKRLESVSTMIRYKGEMVLSTWIEMLNNLINEEIRDDCVDWMEVERVDGESYDVGLYRHYTDPLKPFSESLKPHAHGIAATAAILQDNTDDPELNLQVARERTGSHYFTPHTIHFNALSPFDYKDRTRIFVLDDVNKDQIDDVATACRYLFEASGGGALGLFTAIHRLRQVRDRIIDPLEHAGLPLYAQHVDGIDTSTLVDMFREDPHACLLGTDAVRDGMDVPGESLRLLIYDRVPWPRPRILHKARRKAFGGRRYDEFIARTRIKQAYGRLIRRADDKGIFIMLDSALPSRLHGAFPEGVEVKRTGLAEAIHETKEFLGTKIS